VKPVNAIALLDRELLLTERGISEAEVDYSPEAAAVRAKEHAAKTMISGHGA